MSDMKRKLDALLKHPGLKTGSDWAEERAAQPDPSAKSPTEPTARQDTAPGADTNAPPPPQRLRDMLDRLGMVSGSTLYETRQRDAQEFEAGEYEIDKILNGRVEGNDDYGFYLLRQDYPMEHRQGRIELGAALDSQSRHIAFSACDPRLENFDPRKTLFVDTETIGLAGGAGTVAFLIGAGYFTEDGFRLDQCFMRDYDDEEPMLEYLAGLFDQYESVVSYNGKSFDLPLLRTRFIQNHIPFDAERILHLDLVHVARRFWKRRLANCSLGSVERDILGVEREGDVPSYLIPQMWFDYLRTRDARPLEGVFYHHEMDILSLASLTGWLSRCLAAPDGSGFDHSQDRLSVVRIHFQQKQYEDVLRHGDRLLMAEEGADLRQECLEMLGIAAKRLERFEEMAGYWERALEECPTGLRAHLELAKYCEHKVRDLARAEALCLAALNCLAKGTEAILEGGESASAAFEHRLARIRQKMKRSRRRMADGCKSDLYLSDEDSLS